MNLHLLKKAILIFSLISIIFMPGKSNAQNAKLGFQLGLNSSSTFKNVNSNSSNSFTCGINIVQKLEHNLIVNANVNFLFQKNLYNYPYDYLIDIDPTFIPISEDYYYGYGGGNGLKLNFPLKIGYEIDLYNYSIIPKLGIYATNPINYLDLDYGTVLELEINKKLNKIELFSLMNYQHSSQKEKYYLSSEEIRTSNYAFNIQFGVNLLLGKR